MKAKKTKKFYVCAINSNGEYEYVYDCQNISNESIYDILESLLKRYVKKIDDASSCPARGRSARGLYVI